MHHTIMQRKLIEKLVGVLKTYTEQQIYFLRKVCDLLEKKFCKDSFDSR